ncbi:MAG: endonuclease domain-containing protein, partial [Micrococcales bacterium]|nr:endonuclease domain-containing protein [Micrococcales bacterium]
SGWEANVKLSLVDGTVVVVDVLFKKEKVVVEIDGRKYHQTAAAFSADRVRDNALHASGYQTLRVTHEMIERTPDQFLAHLRALLNRPN